MDMYMWYMDTILHHIGAGTACNLSPSTTGGAVKEVLTHPVCKYRSRKWVTGSYSKCIFGVLTNRNPKTRQRLFYHAKTKQGIVNINVVWVYSGQLAVVMKV